MSGSGDDIEVEEEPWGYDDWEKHFEPNNKGAFIVPRITCWCPCEGHEWCKKIWHSAKAHSITTRWTTEDCVAAQVNHLSTSEHHEDERHLADVNWVAEQNERTPQLIREEQEEWTVDELNNNPPPWVKCPQIKKKPKHPAQPPEPAKGKSKGKGKDKGKDKSGSSRDESKRRRVEAPAPTPVVQLQPPSAPLDSLALQMAGIGRSSHVSFDTIRTVLRLKTVICVLDSLGSTSQKTI